MSYIAHYAAEVPDREAIDALSGPLLLEFGIDACPHCQRAQAAIETALATAPAIRHIKVEDGPGRRLGRSFRVKLWPTLILLQQGREVARVVRPTTLAEVTGLLATPTT